MIEIRGHARGGQGMVTAFEILAKIFSKLGDYQVQSFPAFGVERTGAPIQAFLRVAKSQILNRSNIYHPHLVVVFDESLIEQIPVFDGLREKGSILLNTERPLDQFKNNCDSVFTVPATQISLDKGLGSKALPIVNASMMGAIMKLIDADIEIVKKVVAENVPAKAEQNAEATGIAYNSVVGFGDSTLHLHDFLNESVSAKPEYDKSDWKINFKELKELPREPYWSRPMSDNKTGNWRVLTPEYVTKTPPCTANCPAGTDVRKFVNLSGEKKFKEAADVIYEHNPFPGICGRVCPHFCEQNCNRWELDEGVNIGAVERYLGDKFAADQPEPVKISQKEKIAVIGAGPAGLTAALRLRQKGYEIDVYEALPYAGGMMRTGIPEFRLPQNILDNEIRRIENAGVNIILNKKVTVKELENNYDAVITAVGSHIGSKMKVENEDLLIEGITFLHDFKLKGNDYSIKKGDEVAIIGGGNTAIDVARTSLRLGGKPAIYYRRTHEEMPAIAHEVDEAIAEGVEIKFLTAPVKIQKKNDDEIILTMIDMKLGEPDESGRRRPLPIDGSEKQITVNKAITAIGQWFDDYAFEHKKVEPKQGKIDFEAQVPVFSAGDMAWGGTVTEAIGSGNKAAEEVHAHLKGLHYSHEDVLEQIVLSGDINFNYYLPTPRIHNIAKHEIDFYKNFDEVVSGLTEEEIGAETNRCLHCGDCFSCGNCFNYCPDAAIQIDDAGRLRINYDYCKGCGICVNECPCSSINFNLKEVTYE